jgi:hypothetical protein
MIGSVSDERRRYRHRNLFDLVHSITNAEDGVRSATSDSALTDHDGSQHRSVTYISGVDASSRGQSVAELHAVQAARFLGTSQVNPAGSPNINQSVNAVWTFNPGVKWLSSAQTSVGGTYETQKVRSYFVRQRGLTPTRLIANGGTDILTTDGITEFRDQSHYINEQVIGFDEKLALSVGVRADRGSANGDRATYYSFPKYSASYRFVEPLSFLTSVSMNQGARVYEVGNVRTTACVTSSRAVASSAARRHWLRQAGWAIRQSSPTS